MTRLDSAWQNKVLLCRQRADEVRASRRSVGARYVPPAAPERNPVVPNRAERRLAARQKAAR